MKIKELILHIQCDFHDTSIALSLRDSVITQVHSQGSESFNHIVPMINKCLLESGHTLKDLLAISVNSGPGSYTALRSGFSISKGMCIGLELPLIPISDIYILEEASKKFIQNNNHRNIGNTCILLYTRKNLWLYASENPSNGFPKAGEWLEGSPWPWDEVSGFFANRRDMDHVLRLGLEHHNIYTIEPSASDHHKFAWKHYLSSKFEALTAASPQYIFDPHITQARTKFYNRL